jgi:hypothetical protein
MFLSGFEGPSGRKKLPVSAKRFNPHFGAAHSHLHAPIVPAMNKQAPLNNKETG